MYRFNPLISNLLGHLDVVRQPFEEKKIFKSNHQFNAFKELASHPLIG